MHFCADWRSSGQQLNENRTPSAFSRSDHDIADAMMGIHYSGLLFLEEGGSLGCSRGGLCNGGGEEEWGRNSSLDFCVCVSKRQFFIYTVCALEMKKIFKARVQTPTDIKSHSISLFLSFLLRGRVVYGISYIPHSRDTRFRARISNTRGDHLRQQIDTYIYSKDTRFRARISNTRDGH